MKRAAMLLALLAACGGDAATTVELDAGTGVDASGAAGAAVATGGNAAGAPGVDSGAAGGSSVALDSGTDAMPIQASGGSSGQGGNAERDGGIVVRPDGSMRSRGALSFYAAPDPVVLPDAFMTPPTGSSTTVSVTNFGQAPITLHAIPASVGGSMRLNSGYQFSGDNVFLLSGTCVSSPTIQPGASCLITAKFDPSVATTSGSSGFVWGYWSGSLQIVATVTGEEPIEGNTDLLDLRMSVQVNSRTPGAQ